MPNLDAFVDRDHAVELGFELEEFSSDGGVVFFKQVCEFFIDGLDLLFVETDLQRASGQSQAVFRFPGFDQAFFSSVLSSLRVSL